ncbi:MAG: hypothetical protein JWP32_2519 [Schumannella sp.]|nr:hypothetical protein [Schumannella sp.]
MTPSRGLPFMLRLFGVSELRIDRPDGESWDHTEITEARAAATSTGFIVSMVFWNEPNGLTAHCTEYLIEP